MAKRVWQCESCHGINDYKPWWCPGCNKETCDACFDRYAHCKTCAVGKSDEELRTAANAAGYNFEDKEEIQS